MPRRVWKNPYTKTGCVTCKRRRKKCDGNRPKCDTCVRLGLTCEQTDGFRNIHVINTPPAGALSTNSTSNTSPASTSPFVTFSAVSSPPARLQPGQNSPPIIHGAGPEEQFPTFSSCPADNILEYFNYPFAEPSLTLYNSLLYSSSSSPPSSAPSTEPTDTLTSYSPQEGTLNSPDQLTDLVLPAQLNCIPNLSQADWQNFQYYAEKLSVLIRNGHAPRNPLQSVIVPRMTSSPLLLQAVCSISAQHRANAAPTETKEQLQIAASSYCSRALSSLKDWIPYIYLYPEISTYYDSEALELVLLTSIFLCKHEIIKAGVANWRTHLDGIQSLCRFIENDLRSYNTETVMYARSLYGITYHRSVASITEYAMRKLDNARSPQSIDFDPPCGSTYIVDPYMGLSQSLVSALQRVSWLMGCQFDDEDQQAAFTAEVKSILRLVKKRSWNFKLAFIPADMPPDSITRLIHIARAYESAIFAYLHSIIDSLAEQDIHIHGRNTDLWTNTHRLIPVPKNEAIADFLEEMSGVPIGCPEEPGLLPLLFIISCVTESPDETWEIFKRLELLAANFCLGNINFVGAFVREVWCRRVQSERWGGWRNLLATSQWDLIVS